MTRNNFADGAQFSAEGLDAIVNSADNEGFESGGAPSVGTGNFDVDLTAADYVINQNEFSTGADTVTLSNPSASDRVDIITATTTPGFSVTEGAPATDPNAPTIPTDEVLVAAVFVDSGASSLSSGDINDYRVFLERDAVTYKGNDIDTDGDGKVNDADAADLADDSNQLGGIAAAEYNTFDITTSSGTVSSQNEETVDFAIPIGNVIAVFVQPDDAGLEIGVNLGLDISIIGYTNNSGNLRVRLQDENPDGTHNFTVSVLHT